MVTVHLWLVVENAIKQIKDKRYYEKFQGKDKKINLIGVGFDDKIKNIKEWKQEEFNK